MRVDFSKPILGLDGEPLMVGGQCPTCGNVEGRELLTLGRACANSLNNTAGESLTPQDSAERGLLALAVWNGGEVEIEATDIVLIEKCMARTYAPIVNARAKTLLNGSSE